MVDMAALRRDDHIAYRRTPSRPTGTGAWRPGTVLNLPTRNRNPQLPTAANHGGDHRQVELNLLGGFRLVVGGELVQLGLAGQRLLAALACRGRQATRRQIAHTLWPDATSARAHANLRTALYRLCRCAPGAIHAAASYLQLPVGSRIDLEQSTRLAKTVLGSATPDATPDQDVLGAALHANLYDDLLPDWDDEWLSDHQYQYRLLRINALEALSQQLAESGQHGAAVQTALAAVQADGLRDSAYETLIRACLAQGNRHEAYQHYSRYRRILRDELGLDPPASIGRLLASA